MTTVDFARPPITEVVAGVAFKGASGLTVPRLCELWDAKWKATFPTTEEHAPYLPPVERFGDASVSGPTLSFEFAETPPARLWFVAADSQELIQVQREWFACNWRKVAPDTTYDRWPKRRAAFLRRFNDLEAFVLGAGLGRVAVTQCEVTYVNHIPTGAGWDRLGELHKVLRPLSGLAEPFPPEPEQVQLAMAFVIKDEHQAPVGRLHVTAQPAIRREDRQPMLILNLTARGKPEGEGSDGALKFLDRGRDWIVNTFKQITTREMHEIWGVQ